MSRTTGDTAMAYLDLHHDAPVTMLDHEVTDRRAWTRDSVNNREFAHYRSEFKDDGSRKRHLIRLWIRAAGRRSYDG
jgi:hypothetical protein